MPSNVIANHLLRCPDSQVARATDNHGSPGSRISTTFNGCYEFVKSLNPGYGYHKTDDSPMVQFDFQPKLLAESAISTVSPMAKLLIDAVKFANGKQWLAGSLSLLANVGGSLASSESPIEVKDAKTLQRIGEDKDYPINGNYIQREPIDLDGTQFQSIGTQGNPFIGSYDGGRNPISGLNTCLFNKISCDGSVTNVVITDSKINIASSESSKHLGFIACELSESASLTNNRLVNSTVVTHATRNNNPVGLAVMAGHVSGAAQIAGNEIIDCAMTAARRERAGLVAGLATGDSAFSNNQIHNSSVKVSGRNARASGVVGEASGNVNIERASLTNIELESTGNPDAKVGGVVGSASGTVRIDSTSATGCTTIARGRDTGAAVIVGEASDNVRISNTSVTGCAVFARGSKSQIAFGVGEISGNAHITQTRVTNSILECVGDAGGGAGILRDSAGINGTTLTNTTILTTAPAGDVGGGVGAFYGKTNSFVAHTVIDSSNIISKGRNSDTGFAVGHARGKGTISETVVINSMLKSNEPTSNTGGCVGRLMDDIKVQNHWIKNSSILTTGGEANAGFAAGFASGRANINHTVASDSTIRTSRKSANAGGGAGKLVGQTVLQNTQINNTYIATAGDDSSAGFGVGHASGQANITAMAVSSSRLETSGLNANAGGGAGRLEDTAVLDNLQIDNSKLKTSGANADVGGGAGRLEDKAKLKNIRISSSELLTTGDDADVGFAAGYADSDAAINITDVNTGTVRSFGMNANAGGGAGELTDKALLQKTRIQDSAISAHGQLAHAAAGAGSAAKNSQINDVLSKNTSVVAIGPFSHAGVGAGSLSGSARVEKIAVGCSDIEAQGKFSSAGIGAGIVTDSPRLADILACESLVRADGNANVVAGSVAGIPQFGNVTVCNVRVNDQLINDHCEEVSCSDLCLPATHGPMLRTSPGTTLKPVSSQGSRALLSSASVATTHTTNTMRQASHGSAIPYPTVHSPTLSHSVATNHTTNATRPVLPETVLTSVSPSQVTQTLLLISSVGADQTSRLNNRTAGQVPAMTQQETQALSMGGILGLGIALGVPAIYATVNVARGVRDGLTGLDLVKAPITYMALDVQSLIGAVCRTQTRGAEQDAIPLQTQEERTL